jgi:hypothetical protein
LVYASIPYQNCGSSNDDFQLKSINIIPYPPIRGREAVLTINGTLIKTISSGHMHLTLKYHEIWWMTVLDQSYDLCKVDPDVHCPIKEGPYNLAVSQQIPTNVNGKDVPSGDYKGTIQMVDQDQKEIVCINFQLTLK